MKKVIFFLFIVLTLTACQSHHNVAYFKKHPEKLDAASSRCVDQYPKAEDIPAMRKDPACQAVLQVERLHCNAFADFHPEFQRSFCQDDSFLITRNHFYKRDRNLLF